MIILENLYTVPLRLFQDYYFLVCPILSLKFLVRTPFILRKEFSKKWFASCLIIITCFQQAKCSKEQWAPSELSFIRRTILQTHIVI